ncbi:DNA-directed RNA polymerase subunit H [Caldivirga maquilingensis]|uniref:DNA-directed RNA polymerase subunit Rpo5 n=1 Tax=Caldivirga maquilingensis (strain ATCC 700844 / DSM 13496 / JCM 10307 / IC-167) TaxID=397948 RepID=A8MB43_CALMQ|nr:DNA-directed RNA polymerase subunit H [Caldivirga maquilingensis]ABW02672.1 RNA polymerase Rpb5 [Caldivirga maquilingensis IC-167]
MPRKSTTERKRKTKAEEVLEKVLNHELMPKAEVVPKDNVKALLRRLNAAPWQLPWIRSTDPLVRSLGAKPGDIIRIIRKSPTAGEIEVYRFVVPG